MIKASQISTASIDPTEIGRAHKVFEGSKAFYKVSSSRDETVEYSVKHSAATGFTCDCPAGLQAFSRCKIGVCQHVVIAVAAAREEKEAVAELFRLIDEQTLEAQVKRAMSDEATIKAAEVAREAPVQAPRKARETAPLQRKAFSLMR